MGSKAQRVCSICAKIVAPREENPSYPFCCPACKLVDLGRWLSGEYKVPDAMEAHSEEGASGGGGEHR